MSNIVGEIDSYVDKTYNEQVMESKCYGVAFDKSDRFCKMCEAKKACAEIMEEKEKGLNNLPEIKDDPKNPTKKENPGEEKNTAAVVAEIPEEVKGLPVQEFLEWVRGLGIDTEEIENKYKKSPGILKIKALVIAKKKLAELAK